MGTGNDEVGEVRVTFYHWGRHICDATGRPVTHRERHRLARQQGSTHHMAMNDEERLDAAIDRALRKWADDKGTGQLANFMRAEGITLAPPPAPEPTYTIRLTESERKALIARTEDRMPNGERDPFWRVIFIKLRDAADTPEPGT